MSSCYKRVNFYDLCRLCAQNIQKNKIKIFEREGEKNKLQSKIKKYLCINVKQDDCLPKVVCSKCIKHLEMCITFREECLNSETMLSTYFKNYKHTDEFKRSGKVYIKDTSKSESTIEQSVQPTKNNSKLETLKNFTCSKGTERINISLGEQKVSQSMMTPRKKEFCMKSFKSAFDTNSEELQNQNVQLPLPFDSYKAFRKVVQQLPKEIFSKVVVNSNGEVIHLAGPEMIESVLNDRHILVNKIQKQNRMNKLGQDVYNNVIKIDLTDDDGDNMVPTLGTTYNAVLSNKNRIPEPLTTGNPNVMFPAHPYQNDNNFSNELSGDSVLYQQQQLGMPSSNTTVINVICSSNNGAILDNISSDGRPNDCLASSADTNESQHEDSSDTTVVEDASDIIPKVIHNLSKVNHVCEVCSKTFKRREHLYQHMKLHTGFRPYQCAECKKSFVRKEHLSRHTVLHSGERNFSCDNCHKSFSRHDNLLKHIRTHNKEPSYTCDICQKVFIIKHYYETHRAEHGKGFVGHC